MKKKSSSFRENEILIEQKFELSALVPFRNFIFYHLSPIWQRVINNAGFQPGARLLPNLTKESFSPATSFFFQKAKSGTGTVWSQRLSRRAPFCQYAGSPLQDQKTAIFSTCKAS